MKKGFKVFLIIAGAFIFVLGLAIGALFTPVVKKHLVLLVLGSESANVDIQKVRLRMDRVLLNGLLIEHQNGTMLTMDAARIDIPLRSSSEKTGFFWSCRFRRLAIRST